MIFKIFLSIFISVSFSVAAVKNVHVGTIDTHYADKLSVSELKQIIAEIEQKLESQLQLDLFNDDSLGVAIDIVYLVPSEKKKRLEKNLALLKQKQEKIETLQIYLANIPQKIESIEKNLNIFADHISLMKKRFDEYMIKTTKVKSYTKDEYKIRQIHGEATNKRIKRNVRSLRKERRVLHRKIDDYNRDIVKLNKLINEYNKLRHKTIQINTNNTKIDGSMIALKKLMVETFGQDGKKIEQKSVENSVQNIEIYGFENKNKLKAVLAYEIGHLVGLPNIDTENLTLTQDDIKNFKENF